MQTDLVKIAHQLIETANALIKAAYDPKTISQTTAAPFHGVTELLSREEKLQFFEEGEPSNSSQFEDRTAKIKNFQYQLDSWTKKLENAKTDGERRKARVMVGTYKGHLSKVMNKPSAGGSKWKSRV
jgi:hypothetical protein